MSTHQEVWITLRIKSQLPIETNAEDFALELARDIRQVGPVSDDKQLFMKDSHQIEIISIDEEADIYGTEG